MSYILCEGTVLTFTLSESYGDGGTGFLSLNGDTIINGVPYAGGSGNPSSIWHRLGRSVFVIQFHLRVVILGLVNFHGL